MLHRWEWGGDHICVVLMPQRLRSSCRHSALWLDLASSWTRVSFEHCFWWFWQWHHGDECLLSKNSPWQCQYTGSDCSIHRQLPADGVWAHHDSSREQSNGPDELMHSPASTTAWCLFFFEFSKFAWHTNAQKVSFQQLWSVIDITCYVLLLNFVALLDKLSKNESTRGPTFFGYWESFVAGATKEMEKSSLI